MQVQSLSSLPVRQKGSYTKKFRDTEILTNHYPLIVNSRIQNLYVTVFRISPRIPADNMKKIIDIFEKSKPQVSMLIQNPVLSGGVILSISQPKQKEKQIMVQQFKINLKWVRTINCIKDPNALLFFLNNKFRNSMRIAKYSQIGRTGKFFCLKNKKQIDNLVMYSGFKANFTILQSGIFLRVDSAKKIVRNQTVLQFIDSLYERNSGKDRQDKRNIVKNALVNQIVQVNYGTSKYYKIQDIIYKDLKQQFSSDQKKMNLLDYYKQKYNITIRKQKQPLLKAENKQKNGFEILLVPQLCLMTGIPQDFDQMKRKKISEQTILDPKSKQREITSIIDQLHKSNQFEDLKKVGIQLNTRLYQMKARSIKAPVLQLGGKNSVQEGKQAFFNLFRDPIYQPKHSIKLAILFWRADLRDMLSTFENTSRNLKVEFSFSKYQMRDDRRALEQIRNTLQKAKRDANACLIVIPNHLKTQYKQIKQICLLDNQMVSQVFTEGKLRGKNVQSIATKVLLQIIAKRGNTLWCPKLESRLENTMILGLDNASIGRQNILSAVGTVNSGFTSFYSKCVKYVDNSQKFSAMATATLFIVNYYVQRNKTPPKDIIVFMNSCSRDQVKNLHEFFIEVFLKK